MLFCCPGMCPRCLLFLWLQWKTCGIQLLGLLGGKWGSCWRPARPQDGMTPPRVVLKLQSARTHCSLHRNRAVISLLDCSGYFFTLLFLNAHNLCQIYSSVGAQQKGWAVTLTCFFTTSDFNTTLLTDLSCTAGHLFQHRISVIRKRQESVTDKNRKYKLLLRITSTKDIFLIDLSS